MATLEGQHIILGVTGGIAAYKAAELVRKLRSEGAEVRVIMTQSALEFMQALTFEALSGQPVGVDLFDAASPMAHIDWARWADRIVIAPATADFMARLAAGLADDLLTTLCLAFEGPLTLAPSMNQAMWQHLATQANLKTLISRNLHILMPETGPQACGETGPGRLLEPEAILKALLEARNPGLLHGLRILITAGPTREPIDPVRFISNRSSGRMGFAIAKAASEEGASVTLVHGPTFLPPPQIVKTIPVETSWEMREAVMREVENSDLFIATAAVADYAPLPEPQKIKKSAKEIKLKLHQTPDILAEVAALPRRPFCVGFAAETENLKRHAQKKLEEKQLDLIAANLVGHGQGFETEDNTLTLFWKGGEEHLDKAPKSILAKTLIERIARLYHASHSTQNS